MTSYQTWEFFDFVSCMFYRIVHSEIYLFHIELFGCCCVANANYTLRSDALLLEGNESGHISTE